MAGKRAQPAADVPPVVEEQKSVAPDVEATPQVEEPTTETKPAADAAPVTDESAQVEGRLVGDDTDLAVDADGTVTVLRESPAAANGCRHSIMRPGWAGKGKQRRPVYRCDSCGTELPRGEDGRPSQFEAAR